MALITLPGLLSYPAPVSTNTPAITSVTLNAANAKYAFIFQIPKTGSLTKIGFRSGTVTSGGNVDVRLETIDTTTGLPTGTLYGTTTNITVNVNAATTWFTGTLTAAASVTEGDFVAVVFTTGSLLNLQISHAGTLYSAADDFPYATTDLTGSGTYTKVVAICPNLALCYNVASADTYYPIPFGTSFLNTTAEAFNSGSAPPERGIKFQIPFPCRLSGVWTIITLSTGDFVFNFYTGNSTTPTNVLSIDKDLVGGTAQRIKYYKFATPQVLAANTVYRLTFGPSSASNISIVNVVVGLAAALGSMDVLGTSMVKCSLSGGSWTDLTDTRYWIGLLLDQIDDGSGGGGTGDVRIGISEPLVISNV